MSLFHLRGGAQSHSSLNEKIKFFYFLSLLIFVLTSSKLAFLSFVLLFHTILLFLFRVRFRDYFHYLAEPLFIALMLFLLKSLQIFPFRFNLEKVGENLIIPLKIMGASTLFLCFYFKTSFFEILRLLNWLRIPILLQELIFLTYRFISILHHEVSLIYLSQKVRFGYSNFKNALRSLNLLVQSAFIQNLHHTETFLQSMLQRGYDFKGLRLSSRKAPFKEKIVLILVIIIWGLLWKHL